MQNNVTTKHAGEKTNGLFVGLAAWIVLNWAFKSLQQTFGHFTANTDNTFFVADWMSWFAVFFFVLGWFASHALETALLRRQLGSARLWVISIIIGMIILPPVLSLIITHPVFRELLALAPSLMLSSYFLRSSIYHKEALELAPRVFFREKKKSYPE